MAVARKCDRCGVFYEPSRETKAEYIFVMKDFKEVDLCPGCFAALEKFMAHSELALNTNAGITTSSVCGAKYDCVPNKE